MCFCNILAAWDDRADVSHGSLIEMGPGDKQACTKSRSTYGGDAQPPYLDPPWWTSTEAKEPEYDRVANFQKV